MGYPELDQDESIILETRNVKFKSISLDAILTDKRIILIDSKKNVMPPPGYPAGVHQDCRDGRKCYTGPFFAPYSQHGYGRETPVGYHLFPPGRS
jgi:hypothetical protein